MVSAKAFIALIILLVIAIGAYIYGLYHNIAWLYDWSPEVGGAALVGLGISGIYWAMEG